MNKEQELVLNTIKTFNKGLKVEDTNVNKLVLHKEDTKVLLDYITNLQEENKKLQKDKDRVVSEREDLLSSCLYQDGIIEEIKEYCEEIESRSIDYTDTD